jgi:hypothetical protein
MAGFGNRTGILSGFTDLMVDEEPDIQGKLAVFDPQVFKRSNWLMRDWDANRNQWKSIYNDWFQDFQASEKDFKANVDRDNDYLKYLRDGGFERTLSGLRASARAADETEKTMAMDFAGNQLDKGRILSGGRLGRSSADYARALRVGQRLGAEFAGRDVARERGDLGWVNQVKLGTQGAINRNIDLALNRKLMPQHLSDSELMNLIGGLQGIQGIRMGSASPVFWREKGGWEKAGDVLDTFADGAYKGANAAMTFSGMGGGMGGGGGGSPMSSYNGMTGEGDSAAGVDAMMNGPQPAPARPATAPAPAPTSSPGLFNYNSPTWTDYYRQGYQSPY